MYFAFFTFAAYSEHLHVFTIPTVIKSSYSGEIVGPHLWLTTRSPDPVHVSVSLPGIDYANDVILTRGDPLDITLPETPGSYPGVRLQAPGKSNKTIIVRSSDKVTVYVADEACCGVAFLILPAEHLGTEYYVAAYVPHDFPSFFVVSALGQTTAVNFVTQTGQAHAIVLDPYESYRYEASEDLTSTRVTSDQPISVTSGVISRVPVGWEKYGGLIVNLVPADQWGQNFVIAPYLSSTPCGYVYRILSCNQSTIVTISGSVGSTPLTHNLSAQEFYEGDVEDDTMITIAADQPVSVMKYMKSKNSCGRGAPTLVIVPPIESTYTNVTFPVIDIAYRYGTTYNNINVIIKCDLVDGLRLGTSSMAGWDRLSTADNSTCAVRGEVDSGIHSVVHTNPLASFTVSAYIMTDGWYFYGHAYQIEYVPIRGGYLLKLKQAVMYQN